MPSRKHKGQIQLKNWKEIEIFKRNKKARLTIIWGTRLAKERRTKRQKDRNWLEGLQTDRKSGYHQKVQGRNKIKTKVKYVIMISPQERVYKEKLTNDESVVHALNQTVLGKILTKWHKWRIARFARSLMHLKNVWNISNCIKTRYIYRNLYIQGNQQLLCKIIPKKKNRNDNGFNRMKAKKLVSK